MAQKTDKFDVVIIGSGQAGNPLAGAMAKAGRKTAVIEDQHVGGTCVNDGCTPTKTMIASARVAQLARQAEEFGVSVGEVAVNMDAVRQRKQAVVDVFRDGSEARLKGAGVELIMGRGRLVSGNEVEVNLNSGGTKNLTSDTIFINTGTRPVRPRIDGLDKVPAMDSTSIMELAELPEHLLIIGGGFIGLEFAQMFRRFGSRVTIIHQGERLAEREDDDVAAGLLEVLTDEGIEVIFKAETTKAAERDGGIQLTVERPDGEQVIAGSHLLVAAGRRPNSDRLGLEAAGVDTDERGFIIVNDKLETNVSGVYALGDVKGGPAFTHISYDDYRVVKTNLLEGKDATINDRLVPYVVYTDPQLGRVGLSEGQARDEGLDVRVYKMPMSQVARAIEMNETKGFMKAVVDAKSDLILGVAVLGVEGGELMSTLQVAMMGELTATHMRHAIFAHPALSEALNNLFTEKNVVSVVK